MIMTMISITTNVANINMIKLMNTISTSILVMNIRTTIHYDSYIHTPSAIACYHGKYHYDYPLLLLFLVLLLLLLLPLP